MFFKRLSRDVARHFYIDPDRISVTKVDEFIYRAAVQGPFDDVTAMTKLFNDSTPVHIVISVVVC